MKSACNLGSTPAGRRLVADDVVEFHAARILLLIESCGAPNGRIVGLTKLAKLDFFVRYPAFFARACAAVGRDVPGVATEVESSMVRFHYGPWDHRYYHVLGYLESRHLISVSRRGPRSFSFLILQPGADAAARLFEMPGYRALRSRMVPVGMVFGHYTGTDLKTLIYELFETEVGAQQLGTVIRERDGGLR